MKAVAFFDKIVGTSGKEVLMDVKELVGFVVEKRKGQSLGGRSFSENTAEFLSLCLCAEAGEAASALMKESVYGRKPMSDKSSLPNELADVFIFLAALCDKCSVDLEEAVLNKMKINEERFGKKQC